MDVKSLRDGATMRQFSVFPKESVKSSFLYAFSSGLKDSSSSDDERRVENLFEHLFVLQMNSSLLVNCN